MLLCSHWPGALAQNVLDPQSSKVIERLGKFNELPLSGWRYHSGDIAHGEAASLDDSQWPTATGKVQVGNDAVWFRRTIEVPKTLDGYDLSGARIWFKLNANANGPVPQIIYFNGRRVARR
jgi:alpha-mannosidase